MAAVSPVTRRKVKAVALIAMLSIAEGSRIRSERDSRSSRTRTVDDSTEGVSPWRNIASLLLKMDAANAFAVGPVSIRPDMAASARGRAAMSIPKAQQAAALAAAAALANAAPGRALALKKGPWSTSTLFAEIEAGSVKTLAFEGDYGAKVVATDKDGDRHESNVLPEQGPEIVRSLEAKGIPFTVQGDGIVEQGKGLLNKVLPFVFSIAPWFILAFFLNQRGQFSGGQAPANGKSQSKIEMDPQTGVTFKDVAGCDGSKLELEEVVDFLKDPEKYAALGAKIPKGVIMEGPPGTGKTLLARAVAGEAGVPFVSASGSEFVEIFVGVGASRVRDLFGEAKKNSPCIVFIDEIDAIGRQRGGNIGGNDEREQTLNQILTEMDGFDGTTGVIVIAATNRADVLDSALVRPGRFDRRVPVDLPDVKGRREILNVHVRGKPLSPDLDLDIVAKRTIGFSGASLANLMNEAAIVAARKAKNVITYEEIDYAIDRITVGMEKTTGTNFPARQKLVAYHEAGHAIMGLLTPDYNMVTKVTIVPRSSGAGGFTLFTPVEENIDGGMYTKKFLQAELAVALGGRVAEEIIYGREEITTGASNDLQQVRSIARRMVAQWGFANEQMGEAPIAWEPPEGTTFQTGKTASEETEIEIDREVKALVKAAYQTCLKTLTENRAFLDAMTERLIEEETLDFDQLAKMREEYAVGPALPVKLPA